MKIFLLDFSSEKKILPFLSIYSRNSDEAYHESKVTAENLIPFSNASSNRSFAISILDLNLGSFSPCSNSSAGR
jgi:hypothetical protein